MRFQTAQENLRMKKLIAACVLAAATLPAAATAGEGFLGVQYGTFSSEDADMGNLGISGGMKINDNVAVEAMYTTTIQEEDLGGGDSLSVSGFGVFLKAQSPGDVYVNGRIGVSKIDYDIDLTGSFGFKMAEDANGLTFGLGVGAKIADNASVELQYTKFPDLDLGGVTFANDMIAVGLNFSM